MARRAKPLQHDLEAIRADLAGLRGAVSDLTSEGARAGGAMAKSARRLVRSSAGSGSEIWDHSRDLGTDSMAAVRNGFSVVKRQFEENPLRAALIAIGVGFLLTALRRR